MATVTPSAEELTTLINRVKEADASLGIKKVLVEVQKQEPTWLVSEKRVKKIMADAGLTQTTELVPDASIPVSHIDTEVDIEALTEGLVKSRMINKIVGKGLFATKDIPKNTVLFTEFPFVYFPPWKRYNMVVKGDACGLCARTLRNGNVLVCECPTCKKIRYCTKACRQTAWDSFHRVECATLNPPLKEYLTFCSSENWNAAMGALRCYMRILIANETSPQELDSVLKHLDAFATVSQEERQKKETSWEMMGDNSQKMWKTGLELLIKGCQYPLKVHDKKIPAVLTKPLPENIAESLFTMDTYLRFLGRYNINNQDGGLYLLHSGLNHSCVPNAIIDHPGAGTNYGVSVRLARDIRKNEELYITYCDPRWGKATRQQYLQTEYLFHCKCKRCTGTDDHLSPELLSALGVAPSE